MDEPLQAYTLNEVRYYLLVTPCANCGKGPLVADPPASLPAGQPLTLDVRCGHCQAHRQIQAVCGHPMSQQEPDAEIINPTSSPSRIIDLGQWLSLFYMFVESAAGDPSRPQARLTGFKAALCLAEALKFYGDNELPPPSAFFSPTTSDIFRQHPEKFARQRLRDMQAKLPSLTVMARHVARDERSKGRWWQFWKRQV